MAIEGQADTTTQTTSTETKPADTTTQASTADTASTQKPATGTNSGDDPRIKGLLADIQKERKSRQDFEKRFKDLEGRYSERDRQFNALAGVKQPTAEEAEYEAIRQQLNKVRPDLGKLDDTTIDKLIKLAESSDGLMEVQRNHWNRHGQQMVDTLASEVSEIIGGDLTDRQRRSMIATYIADVEQDADLRAKYDAGDTKHLKEFAKAWADEWLTAAKRKVTATNIGQNRPVPRSGDRSVTTSAGKKIDVNDNKAVEDLLVEGFRNRGGEFGRR